ncbi:MAG: RES family NAD+ phosphorylase [Burkholderiales bacterium]|nr:RES family NAD+ phosphorylase [Burkholderiales bacterium]
MAPLPAELFSANADFHGDLLRNIPGIRDSQDLFDDLTDDPADHAVAIAAEGAGRLSTTGAAISRPFDYGRVISYSFESSHWQQTRFSDGRRFGVWYGALELETTVHETAWHWQRFVLDSFAGEARTIVTERRVFNVRCDALLVDLRGQERRHAALVDRDSYAFTHRVGDYLHDQGANGLLVASARCHGINAAVFRPERLSNVRDRAYLTYRLDLARNRLVVERTRGRAWMRITPGQAG